MKLLDIPINHNHIQARVDGFKDWLNQLNQEQLEAILIDIEQYLLDCATSEEENDNDSYAPVQAAIKISESRWWIAQFL